MSEYDYDNRFVCAACFSDEGIQGFIERALKSKECSFCGAESDEPIAAPFKEVARHINESLYQDYDDAANCMAYVSADGGYQGETWSTHELLISEISLELPRDEDDSLLQALVSRLDDNAWCQRDPYNLNYAQQTQFSWDRFSHIVKHQRRYFFRDDEEGDGEVLSPGELLETILDHAQKIGLLVRVEKGALRVARTRPQPDGIAWKAPLDLGPPPLEKAIQSNRMSPAGIVMFYTSDQEETALRETAQSRGPGNYATGIFSNARDIVLLDLVLCPVCNLSNVALSDGYDFYPRRARNANRPPEAIA